MIGFIELHEHSGDPKTARPISFALSAIVSFAPSASRNGCCYLEWSCGNEAREITLQESYEEVLGNLKTFQQQLAAASTPPKPFVRTHTRK